MRSTIGGSLLVVVGACTSGPLAPPSETYERDCITEVTAGGVLPGTADALVVSSGCDGEPSRMDIVAYGSSLTALHGVAFEARVHGARVVELDGATPAEVVALTDDGLGYAAWFSGPTSTPRTVRFARPIVDLVTADLDLDTARDVIVAGDGAIRVALGGAEDEVSLVTATRDIVNVVTRPGAVTQHLIYVATTNTGYELGVALDSGVLEYGIAQVFPLEPGPRLPLVTGSIGGDLVVYGATSKVFAYSAFSGGVTTLDEGALAIATGRFHAPHDEAMFLARDGLAIKRVTNDPDHLSPTGSVTELVLEEEARAFTVGDLDDNGVDDFAVVHGRLGQPGTRVRVHFN